MSFSALSSSQGAGHTGGGGGGGGSLFMNVPPTTDYGSISDGYIRLAAVAPVSSAMRQRFRPIYQLGQSRYVGGPRNTGDGEAKFEGGGSFSTTKK